MSLAVNTYQRDPETNKIHWQESEHPSEELAGFENCRQTLWGSNAARRLGLVLLPLLAHQDIYAEGDDLLLLAQEAQMVLESVEDLANETGVAAAYITIRTQNIVAAIARAKALPRGGVAIW